MTEKHYIYTANGTKIEVEPFIEAENLTISFDFILNKADTSVSNVTFFGKTAELIKELRNDTQNIFTALKYEIEFVDKNETLLVERYLDMKSYEHEKEKNYVKIGFLKNIDEQNIKELAKTINFESFTGYQNIPYVTSSIPDNNEILLLFFATSYITFELVKVIIDLSKNGAETATVIGAGSGITGAIANAIKIATLSVNAVLLINRIIKLTIQPIKYKRFAYVRDLIDYGARQIGFVNGSNTFFHSNPHFRNSIIVCKSFFNPSTDNDGLRGFVNSNSNILDVYDKTFEALISECQRVFKLLKFQQSNDGTQLILDLEDIPITASYQIANYSNVVHSDNSDSLAANLHLSFSTDINDLNTIDFYEGTTYTVQTLRTSIVPVQRNLLTGLEDITSVWCRAIDKRKLTIPEKIVSAFLKAIQKVLDTLFDILDVVIDGINAVIKVLNKILNFLGLKWKIPTLDKPNRPDFGNAIENRIGMMVLSNDFLANEKFAVINPNDKPKLRTLNRVVDMQQIYYICHQRYILTNNLKNRTSYLAVRNRLEDFNTMTRERALIDENGNVQRILSIEWNKTIKQSVINTEDIKALPISNLIVKETKYGTN
jgi:hypothetical protein